ALDLGFDLVRITTADDFPEAERRTLDRLASGDLQGLAWLTPEWIRRSCRPRALLPEARSLICLGVSYLVDRDDTPPSTEGPRGRVARYAWGRDYHRVLRKKARRLVQWLSTQVGREVAWRAFVDSSPFADRAAAQRAGVGWFGKNTMIITTSGFGSWVFLAAIAVDVELDPDKPDPRDCGQCRACLDACPTGALVEPYVLNAARCIAYQTIENRGSVPHELRPLMGDWIFGCDVCQEVCPWNRRARPGRHPEFALQEPERDRPMLVPLLDLSEDAFERRFAGSPIRRTKRRGLLRNVAVALGNSGDPAAVPALAAALADDDPVVRGHAAWALGQLGTDDARTALVSALTREADPSVRAEIARALGVEEESVADRAERTPAPLSCSDGRRRRR
ncbi:MAG TPA: tRNA epoxyqueuosine(34) reductase QueG, partial [Chloroflexota bacterium]